MRILAVYNIMLFKYWDNYICCLIRIWVLVYVFSDMHVKGKFCYCANKTAVFPCAKCVNACELLSPCIPLDGDASRVL